MDDVTGRSIISYEMIEAGALALSEYDRERETHEEGAIRIFLAMLKAAEHARKWCS
jgi:hypothetical protein